MQKTREELKKYGIDKNTSLAIVDTIFRMADNENEANKILEDGPESIYFNRAVKQAIAMQRGKSNFFTNDPYGYLFWGDLAIIDVCKKTVVWGEERKELKHSIEHKCRLEHLFDYFNKDCFKSDDIRYESGRLIKRYLDNAN